MGAGYSALLRAVNILGTNETLYVFQRLDYEVTPNVHFIGHAESFPFQDTKIHLNRLNREGFDEIVLLLTGDRKKDSEAIQFTNQIQAPHHLFIQGAKLPCLTPEAAYKYSSDQWVSTNDSPGSTNRKSATPLYAIIGTYNEEDIVYATVKHAFQQGCKKVFLVDNGSKDRTVAEALAAGAELALSYETSKYVELLRIRLMNDLVERLSLESSYDAIWWLWLDADEFPEGPNGQTVGTMLEQLGEEYRIAGCSLVNHLPTSEPYYIQRYHPGDFMQYGEAYNPSSLKVKHCSSCHWKHPLQKFVRQAPIVRSLSGFHMAICKEKLLEPTSTIVFHHFPFREKDSTLQKYGKLCGIEGSNGNRVSFDDSVSLNGRSCIRRRYDNLLHIYNAQWDKVSITPGENPTTGIKLSKFMTSGTTWHLRTGNERT